MSQNKEKSGMSWLKVVFFSIVAGLYTGIIMTIPSLENTSFQDIGISYEWWVIFAVILVVNCKKSWEAMIKCFVFFLISQPLIYLVEVFLGHITFDSALVYYLKIWGPVTLLTLPGGFIAYFCKKQNIFGSLILGLGNTIQLTLAVIYIGKSIQNFPNHILSAIVCILSIFIMSFVIQKKKMYRWISIILPVFLFIGILIFLKIDGRVLF